MKRILLIVLLIIASTAVGLAEGEKPVTRIDVFHKTRPPAMKTLAEVIPVLRRCADEDRIHLHIIGDSTSAALIEAYNLPGTDFPFAVVIDGRYSARIGERQVDFVHFPDFMHGIGRHEGNWSLQDLETVLKDPGLLLNENIPPVLPDEGSHGD